MLPLVVPLFVNAFRRAEEMAVAMEARCYVSGAGRTRFVQLHAHLIDYVVVVGMLCYVVAVWYGAELIFSEVLARFT